MRCNDVSVGRQRPLRVPTSCEDLLTPFRRLEASATLTVTHTACPREKQWCKFQRCVQFRPTPHYRFFYLSVTRTPRNQVQYTVKKKKNPCSVCRVIESLRTIAIMFHDRESVTNEMQVGL